MNVDDIEQVDPRVLARTYQTAVGRISRAPVEADFWLVFTFDVGDLVSRVEFHPTEAAAREAASGTRAD